MIRDPNEIIQQFFSNMQKFVEEQSWQASAMMSQDMAEQPSKPSAIPSQDTTHRPDRPGTEPSTYTAQRTVQRPGEGIDSLAQGDIIDVLNNVVGKLEEFGSRLQKVEKRVGIKVELQKKEPVDQAELPGAASPEHH